MHPEVFTFPPAFPFLWEKYKIALGAFWVAEELDIERDEAAWEDEMLEFEKELVRNLLALTAANSSMVDPLLLNIFFANFKDKEIGYFATYASMMSNTQMEAAALFFDKLEENGDEYTKLLNKFSKSEHMVAKGAWLNAIIRSIECDLHTKIVAMICALSVFKATLYYVYSCNDECSGTEAVSSYKQNVTEDSEHHFDYLVNLLRETQGKINEEEIIMMLREAIDLEINVLESDVIKDTIHPSSCPEREYVYIMADRVLMMLRILPRFSDKA